MRNPSEPLSGPSPRGWGKLFHRTIKFLFVRTIPTRVGKTKHCVGAVRINADHPHAGGENNTGRSGRGERCGPSPRGWGKPPRGPGAAATHRTIPTRVGKTRSGLTTKDISTDHPHAGGENALVGREVVARRGPSPRGWGKRARRAAWRCPSRTIPTRVGKTFRRTKAWPCLPDHPHAGGENDPAQARVWEDHGPSPRGWGKPGGQTRPPHSTRTIPTRVGKTIRRTSDGRYVSDHPHAGGENPMFMVEESAVDGPSPRGWGKLRARPFPHPRRRTIPTRVGKTSSFHRSHSHPPDHPHAGGENQER